MMEDRQRNGRLPDSTSAEESNWVKVFGKADDLFDQLLAPKTCPRRRGR